MNETGYLQANEHKLYYNYSKPVGKIKTAIIFVHAASGNRLGPHRMFVEMEEKFYKLGYAVIRFDFAGCGDSTGTGPMQSLQQDCSDLAKVYDFFQRKEALEKIFLIGISRGARLCFHAIKTHKIKANGMILLSASYLDNTIFLKLLISHIKQYFTKLISPDGFKKLITGSVNFKGILRTFAFCFQFKQKKESSTSKSKFNAKCPLLFIYGGNDPITNKSKSNYSQICKKNNINHKCITIDNANHSFFHYRWKEQLFKICKQWIENITQEN